MVNAAARLVRFSLNVVPSCGCNYTIRLVHIKCSMASNSIPSNIIMEDSKHYIIPDAELGNPQAPAPVMFHLGWQVD